MNLRSRLLVVAGLAAGVAGLTALLGPTPPRVAAGDDPKGGPATANPVANKGDHVMFGNTPDRNFVNLNPVSLSAEFPKSPDDDKAHVLGNRVKWKAKLGSRAYGGPIVAGGKVFVGTNNEKPRNQRDTGQGDDGDPSRSTRAS